MFPPTKVPDLSAYFPDESQVGYLQTTATGAEPNAFETAIAAPSHTYIYPLVVPAPAETQANSGTKKADEAQPAKDFLSARYWGNLSPQYSVDSAHYGLPGASAKVPAGCELTQVHILQRHGSRYPTDGEKPSRFAAAIAAAASNATSGGFSATGALAFLESWTYKLGAEILTHFGRQQVFDLGVGARLAYGHLLHNFTEQGQLPVFRTTSQDRMVKTAQNWAAGFFGIPSEGQYNLEIMVEEYYVNNTAAPYDSCPVAYLDAAYPGTNTQSVYYETALAPTAARLNKLVSGLEFDTADVAAMLQLCAYETIALGYSAFCEVFSEDEFKAWHYGYDIAFYGDSFMGSPVAAAQGKGYVEEFHARLTQTNISTYDSSTNRTLDSDPVLFPLNQSIYADFTHEVSLLNVLAALNLTALSPAAPSATHPGADGHVFDAGKTVPMATHWEAQVLECTASQPTKQIRFVLNDAVVPLTYKGCDAKEFNGLCALDTVIEALKERIDEIDFDYDCYANYTLPVGISDLNGRAPRH